jgi:hypothetical protein
MEKSVGQDARNQENCSARASSIQIPLTKITSIPPGIQVLASSAFVGDRSVVEEVIFEPGSQVQTISARTFGSFHSLKSVVVGSSVEVLGEKCFGDGRSRSRVKFETNSKLRIIDKLAFACSELESIEIPRLVETLGDSCFQSCGKLSSLEFEADCRLRRLGSRAIAWCLSLRSICIPASVEFIGEDCFFDCERLSSVSFESGSQLSTIGAKAFSHCKMLGPSIQLPSSLEAVPVDCFNYCKGLSLIEFGPNSTVRAIRARAFEGCSLISFRIPASVVAIDWSCFSKCGETTEITFESPSKLEEISQFDLGSIGVVSFPDSVLSLTVSRGSHGRFVGNFGRDSQLRELRAYGPGLRGSGFIRLSEPSLKRIRSAAEWKKS